jgi:hypothetical protein
MPTGTMREMYSGIQDWSSPLSLQLSRARRPDRRTSATASATTSGVPSATMRILIRRRHGRLPRAASREPRDERTASMSVLTLTAQAM